MSGEDRARLVEHARYIWQRAAFQNGGRMQAPSVASDWPSAHKPTILLVSFHNRVSGRMPLRLTDFQTNTAQAARGPGRPGSKLTLDRFRSSVRTEGSTHPEGSDVWRQIPQTSCSEKVGCIAEWPRIASCIHTVAFRNPDHHSLSRSRKEHSVRVCQVAPLPF